MVASQLPLVDELFLLPLNCKITKRTIAPDNKRTAVKLDASIVFSPSANRHSTEFAAKATRANTVKAIVLINMSSDLLDK